MIFSNIVINEKIPSAEDYINKTIEKKDKWNQMNVSSMESILGANGCMTLLHISKQENLDWRDKSKYQWVFFWIYV